MSLVQQMLELPQIAMFLMWSQKFCCVYCVLMSMNLIFLIWMIA